MAHKMIACREILPDSDCTLILIGEADEVTAALRAHADSAHESTPGDLDDRVNSKLQKAILVGRKEAYVGDDFQETENGEIKIDGPAAVVRQVAAAGATTLSCTCFAVPDGSCKTIVSGGTGVATCSNDTCTDCGWNVVSTGLVDELLTVLKPPA
jgi:hypothetical protein